MKEKSKLGPWGLYRLLVVPCMFLCAFVKKPFTRWLSLAAFTVWFVITLGGMLKDWMQRRKARRPESVSKNAPAKAKEVPVGISDEDVFTIRQVNYRVTEQLKHTYPKVSWLWETRPDATQLRAGGTWKARLDNCEPYNFAEIKFEPSGRMEITLIQANALRDKQALADQTPAESTDPSDLTEEDELDRTDAQTWYSQYGAERLATIIDGLDPLGHKSLTIREDGEIVIHSGSKEVAVEKLEWMLPKIGWKDLCVLFKEDDITAKANENNLVLSW